MHCASVVVGEKGHVIMYHAHAHAELTETKTLTSGMNAFSLALVS
jgi:hypothetical protein